MIYTEQMERGGLVSYKIGSFNLRNLGLSSMGSDNPRSLSTIAKIINDEGFDIVALQEVLSEGKAFRSEDYAKKSILMELGTEWNFEWADSGAENDFRHEGYAFVWRNKRVDLASTEVSTRYGNVKRTFYPRMCKTNREYIHRRPYYGRFTTKGVLGGPNIEFRLICVHTHYGSDNATDRKIRQHELDVLMKEIYPQISDRRYGDPLVAYTILLGDYNAELWTKDSKIWQQPLKAARGIGKPAIMDTNDDGVVFSEKYNGRAIKTVQDQLTTLKAKMTENNEENFDTSGYSFNYDHFSYEEAKFQGVKVQVRRITDAVTKYCKLADNDYSSAFEKYYKTVSDHIPIMMEIDIR